MFVVGKYRTHFFFTYSEHKIRGFDFFRSLIFVADVKRGPDFFPEIEEVGSSLDSIPGMLSLLRHFAVSPPRSRPRPHGSLELVEEIRFVFQIPIQTTFRGGRFSGLNKDKMKGLRDAGPG